MQTHSGLWEFPGGKVEPEESFFEALVREIKEEINIKIGDAKHYTTIKHQYADYHVNLMFYVVLDYSGSPKCNESQKALKWINIDELQYEQFPEGNYQVIHKLKKEYVF